MEHESQYPTIALLLSPSGIDCRLLLDGVDVSRFVRGVEVLAAVNTLTTVRLTVLANVEVTGEAARVLLVLPKEMTDAPT